MSANSSAGGEKCARNASAINNIARRIAQCICGGRRRRCGYQAWLSVGAGGCRLAGSGAISEGRQWEVARWPASEVASRRLVSVTAYAWPHRGKALMRDAGVSLATSAVISDVGMLWGKEAACSALCASSLIAALTRWRSAKQYGRNSNQRNKRSRHRGSSSQRMAAPLGRIGNGAGRRRRAQRSRGGRRSSWRQQQHSRWRSAASLARKPFTVAGKRHGVTSQSNINIANMIMPCAVNNQLAVQIMA